MSSAFRSLTFISLIGIFQIANAVEIIDLGTLGGGPTRAFDINDSGVVVGRSHNGITEIGFIWNNGVMMPLRAQPGAFNDNQPSTAVSINNLGVVVGLRDSTGFYLLNGRQFDAPLIPSAVNDGGLITGFRDTNNGVTHAYTYSIDHDILRDLGMTSQRSFALAVNNAGTVVGDNGTPPIAHRLTPLTPLPILNQGGFSNAFAVNNNGQIAGKSDMVVFETSFHVDHPVLWENDEIIDLLDSTSRSSGTAYDINDAGVIVGEIDNHASVYINGGWVDLNDFLPGPTEVNGVSLPAGYPWRTLSVARAINNNNEIVGYGEFWSGQTRAFLITGFAPPNAPPVADAGPDETAYANEVVYLDGTGSTDDRTPSAMLTYAWTFVEKPSGSSATLIGPTTSNPTFNPDRLGSYVVQLIVADDDGLSSIADTVTITLANSAPTANAGVGQDVHGGTMVRLNGSASTDDFTAPSALGYAWSFQSRPSASGAVLDGADTSTPTFVADVLGNYVVQLVVTDEGGLSSVAATATITAGNASPVANAGANQTDVVDTTMTLDGSSSGDPDGDMLTFAWSFVAKPAGSVAALTGANTAAPSFVADVPGLYVVGLVVSDRWSPSAQAQVTITANSAADYVKDIFEIIRTGLVNLNVADFDAPGHQSALLNLLNQAETKFLAGDFGAAMEKLRQAMARTDGYPTHGALDARGSGQDWIIAASDQEYFYPLYQFAIDMLSEQAETAHQARHGHKHGRGHHHRHPFPPVDIRNCAADRDRNAKHEPQWKDQRR